MKYIIPLLVLCCLSVGNTYAQKPVNPCCEIVGTNASKGIITTRNTTTGKVQKFKTSPTAMGRLRMGDKLTLQNGRITAVNGNG